MNRRTAAYLVGMLFLMATVVAAQAPPATQPDGRGGRGRGGRGGARGPTTHPGMLQDAQTGQWYTPMQHAPYAFGADLSYVKQLEDGGKVFKDLDGQPKPVLRIFSEHGYNWIRLRTCVEPTSGRLPNTTEYTVALAQQAKKYGMKFMLDFHYSNGWADPTNEPTPAQWAQMNPDQMAEAVFAYTRDTVAAMVAGGVTPDIVQVGNEIGNGFMWPTGDIRNPANWDNFAKLLSAGVRGVDAGIGNAKKPQIMIHVDHGGNIALTRAFFDKLNTYNIPYDAIGFSFYPWSHGNLMDMRANFAFAATTYNKDVYLVETGYYHTPSRYFSQTPGPFPETPQGQAQWLEEVNRIVMETPGGRGKGVMWWEPAASGGLVNRGYFDADGNAQPILEVFHKYTRPVHRTDNQ